MPSVPRLVCPSCAQSLDDRSATSTCPACGSLLTLSFAVGKSATTLKAAFAARRQAMTGIESSGVWRYRELVFPTVADRDIVSYPEGNTPLVASDRVATYAGVAGLRIKHEGMNPTGSFKDRGMTVAMTQARRVSATAVACASTGNTSASLAAYAAIGALKGLVLIPAGKISSGKLAQTAAHGARIVQVRGNFDDCLRLLREAEKSLGVYVVNSVNPFRLAGQRTIVFEMLQQLDWNAPDWIVLPAGNLGNTSAFGEALAMAKDCGLIDRMPRIAAIQAAGASPFAQSFAGGLKERISVEPETVATAIRIGAPASWDRAVKAITESNGVVISVSDDDIMDAKQNVDRAGIGCEPASAASIAGVKALVRSNTIAPDARVVAVLTGHLLKDPEAAMRHEARATVIDPTVAALERLVSGETL